MPVSLSVVVPVKDEAENVASLAREIEAAVKPWPHEIIFVDDGSTDGTGGILAGLKSEIPSLRVMQHSRNLGQSRGWRTGVMAATGATIVTLDGDGQNDPADIPKLIAALDGPAPGETIGLVSGVRADRQDAGNRKLASGLANRFRRAMLNDGAVDSGCGLKAFRREAYLALPYFDHMHRFLIALMLREGYAVRFVTVNHRARQHGQSKYNNFHRAMVGLVDTFAVRWLQKRHGGRVDTREI
ncbi:MAG TPA: glycosyltransferase family 2 protein [Rhizomicrobium sp.]|nr:glycosyltransferase family 2 protein [Rhizomicrobium sp.]